MRVKFGDHIDACSRITHSNNSQLLLVTTGNGVYTVDIKSVEIAEKLFEKALINGYLDTSGYEYSN